MTAANPDHRTGLPPAPGDDRPQRAARVEEGRWLGGVCTGLAEHLGWPVLALRLAFVALALFQFVGVAVYAVLWLVLPPAPPREQPPGVRAHDRAGFRRTLLGRTGGADVGAVVAMGVLTVGVAVLVQVLGVGVRPTLFWPIALGLGGAALIWRQADALVTSPRRAVDARPVRRRWLGALRVFVGLVAMATAVALLAVTQASARPLTQLGVLLLLGVAAVAAVTAPFVYRSRQALDTAREAQIRADARADMAAHLHDSVLQTLALIQRQSDDQRAVQRLARRQERELRTWLYGDTPRATSLKASLQQAAAEVEDTHDVPVDLVVVGDAEHDDTVAALVQAAREALVNAAKHSGADRIDVYAEVGDDLEIFVRDRGRGFDPTRVGEDRHGIRHSIVGRTERHGGHASVRSAPGEGAEIRLVLRRPHHPTREEDR